MENTFTINVSISTKSYIGKNQSWNTTTYLKTKLTVSEFINKIKDGYCYCYVFNDLDEEFGQSVKTLNNFLYSNVLSIDIDDSQIEMNRYIDNLSIKPTFAYTTPSNGVKGYRFRLVYIFNDKIKGVEDYKAAYKALISKLNITLTDNCASSPAQQMGGNDNAEVYVTNIVYSNDILESKSNIENKQTEIKSEKQVEIKTDIKFDLNPEFLQDFNQNDYLTFLTKYLELYPFFSSSNLEYISEDTPYILLPKNYIEIKRYWLIDKVIDDDNEIVSKTCVPKRIKDGEHRRNKLFINGILRRFITDDKISNENMLTMLVYELYYYIDNRVDKITKQQLYNITASVMNADLTKYEKLSKQEHPKFIVNDDYCIKYGINRRQARNLSKKILTYNEIGNLYDCLLSDKENLEVMKSFGLNISLRTLKYFKEYAGLTRTRNTNKNIDNIELSTEDNTEYIDYNLNYIFKNYTENIFKKIA